MLRRPLALLATALLLGAATVPGTARADQVRDDEESLLTAVRAQQAWNVSRGGGVTVAVLDSGVDEDQQDLAGSVTAGPDYTQGANPPGVLPKRLHGTNMASIIAGHGHGPGGADGIIGVAPEARILSVRVVLENDEPGFQIFNGNERFDGSIAKGIRYAVDHGAKVINMSLGKAESTKQDRQAVDYAVSKGVVIVAAAGNQGASRTARRDGHAPYSYPASYPGVIAVAAVDAAHRHAGFSNRNSAVVVSAPGVKVIGAGPDDTYWVGDGTSPATAFVSGVVALIRSRYPGLQPALVTQAIVASTANRPSSGYDPGVGFGEVDAAAALAAAQRLTGAKMTGAGQDAGRPLTGDGAVPPIQVVHRDNGVLVTWSVVGLLGLVGLTVAVGFLVARRPARS
ncbi:S8 family serine peptidase [Actinomadura scrupuli]|uniref:S8 family serine peptidase n=1 Tax=Actinomadura scrupuli TaxID=559629 RepID=UPI003D980C87